MKIISFSFIDTHEFNDKSHMKIISTNLLIHMKLMKLIYTNL